MSDYEITTAPIDITSFGLGSARVVDSNRGFKQTADALPGSHEVWGNYFNNVLRGKIDGPWYGSSASTNCDYSKTFSDTSETGEKPPQIGDDYIENIGHPGTKGQGFPDGGFVPTVASPGVSSVDGEVNLNPTDIPALDGALVTKLDRHGTNGSWLSPQDGSTCQTTQNAGQVDQISPNYEMGMYAWSTSKSPRPV